MIDPEPIIKILADRCLQAKGLECSVLGDVIDLIHAAPDVGEKWIPVKTKLPELHIDFWDDESGERGEFEVSEFVLGCDKEGKTQVVRYETGPLYTGWADINGEEYDIRYWKPIHIPNRMRE